MSLWVTLCPGAAEVRVLGHVTPEARVRGCIRFCPRPALVSMEIAAKTDPGQPIAFLLPALVKDVRVHARPPPARRIWAAPANPKDLTSSRGEITGSAQCAYCRFRFSRFRRPCQCQLPCVACRGGLEAAAVTGDAAM